MRSHHYYLFVAQWAEISLKPGKKIPNGFFSNWNPLKNAKVIFTFYDYIWESFARQLPLGVVPQFFDTIKTH